MWLGWNVLIVFNFGKPYGFQCWRYACHIWEWLDHTEHQPRSFVTLWNFAINHYSDFIMGTIAIYSVSNHQPDDCLLNRLFRRRSKKTSTLRVTGPCAGNSPGTGEFSAQMASNAENVFIWWRHHALPWDIEIVLVSRMADIFPRMTSCPFLPFHANRENDF